MIKGDNTIVLDVDLSTMEDAVFDNILHGTFRRPFLYLIFTSIALGFDSFVFGMVSCRIPSLKEASTFVSSTLSGKVKLRVKLP